MDDAKPTPAVKPPTRLDFIESLRRRLLARLSIRRRLAMWYATLLAMTLVLFSVIVYTVAQNQLQSSVNEEIKGRAVAIADALQGAQDSVGQPAANATATSGPATPTPTHSATHVPTHATTSPGATSNATPNATTEATPVPTVDPKSSQTIQKQLIKVPGILGRLDLGFEVLDVKGNPKSSSLASGLPLNQGVIAAALLGTPGTYTAVSTSDPRSLLAIYVQPITISTPSSADDSGDATDTPTGNATITPSQAAQEIIGVVLVAKPLDDVNSALSTLSHLLIMGSLIATLFALLGGWFIAENALRPIPAVTSAARAIATSAHEASLGTRVIYSGPRDEVGDLVATFNDMLEALERISNAQRRFVADASHELRAPLTTIKTTLDFLRGAPDIPAEDRQEMLENGYSEAERMATLVNDLLLLARVDAADGAKYGLHESWLDDQLRGRRESVELDQLAMDVFRQGANLGEARRKDLHFSVLNLEPVTVLGDPGQLRQLALILIDNAIKYTPAGGKIRIAVSRNGQMAAFTVSDTGIGIPAEARAHIFERFYRADEARDREYGSGLGLAIGKWIAEAHHGEISVLSQPGQGSTFTVLLPAIRWSEGWPASSPMVAVSREQTPAGALGRLVRPRKPTRSRPKDEAAKNDEQRTATHSANGQKRISAAPINGNGNGRSNGRATPTPSLRSNRAARRRPPPV